jgi:hypothetical protein
MAAFSVRRRKANLQAKSGGICDVVDMEHPEPSVSEQHVENNYSVIGQVPGQIGSPKLSISLHHLLKHFEM